MYQSISFALSTTKSTIRILLTGMLTTLLLALPAAAQTEFGWTPDGPQIGETVEFTILDDSAIPEFWDFGGEGCDGQESTFDCSWAPEHCRHITFQYASSGSKTVRLVTDQGETVHTLEVADAGECCAKDGRPDTAFTMYPNPTYAGQVVHFSDISPQQQKSVKTVALEWFPNEDLEIGEAIVFHLAGIDSVQKVDWSFGEPGCGDLASEQTCEPTIVNCLSTTFTYASGGEKTVQATIDDGAYTLTAQLTINNTGECDTGGPGTCIYLISPPSMAFDASGGTGRITVSTGPDCAWTATETAGWITIVNGESGTGSGAVEYQVAENAGNARQARILAAGKSHAITQAAADTGDLDIAPTEWSWTVTLDGVEHASSDQPNFSASFDEPGLYAVHLRASNCQGSTLATGTMLIEEQTTAEDGWLVPSAVHAPGLNNTQWRTDLSIHNPSTATMFLLLEFRPENTDNVGAALDRWGIDVAPGATALLDDVLTLIPGLIEPGESELGSILITVTSGGDGMQPRIASRTYNQTLVGTYGQYVQAVAVPVREYEHIFLPGLVDNDAYRTNIRFANLGDDAVTPAIRLFDNDGFSISEGLDRTIPPRSTFQINGIAGVAGISESLDSFMVRITTHADTLLAWASVVDNITGDPVLYNPIVVDHASSTLWLPGVADLPGANDSQWQSDLTVLNPETGPVSSVVRYIPSEDLPLPPDLVFDRTRPRTSQTFIDVLGDHVLPPDVDSKGYFVIEGVDQNPPVQPASRTYNVSEDGGTFGQNLFVFRGTSLIEAGSGGIVPGIIFSSETTTGSRTNLGVLNTDTEAWAQIRITVLDHIGAEAAQLDDFWLGPGKLAQFNLAKRLGLADVDLRGTVVIDNLAGGLVAAYASVVDNVTQDPVLIPATPNSAVE